MMIVLFGPPGSGKGTQAENIVSKYDNVYHLSVGEVFRKLVKEDDSKLASTVRSYIERGALVPVEIVVDVVRRDLLKHRDSCDHFLLDGFPRSVEQANYFNILLAEFNQDYAVISLDVPDTVLIERLTNRQACAKCGSISTKQVKECPKCGSTEFVQRKDDTVEVISERLKLYHDVCSEVLTFFEAQDKNKVFIIDGNCDINIIKNNLFDILETKIFKRDN